MNVWNQDKSPLTWGYPNLEFNFEVVEQQQNNSFIINSFVVQQQQ